MATLLPSKADIAHITPIACPACAIGSAHLTRRSPNPYRAEGQSEIWVFKCDNCGIENTQTVET